MRLTGSRAYYRQTPPKMPPGLTELMEGLTKQVLQHNPTEVYEFCTRHMQHLLEIRDGPPRNKTLTLEEKISKAQTKMRQRSEKRRQEYDKNVLLQQQQYKNEADEKLDINSRNEEFTLASPETLVPPIVLKTSVHHEQELANSFETEISHEVCTNQTKKAYPISENVTNAETVISDIKFNETKSTFDETENVGNIPTNENNDNEVISQPNENNICRNDASDNMMQEGNMHNNGSGNYEEQNESEKNTDKQSTEENDSNQEQIENVDVHGYNYVNIDEKKNPETNIDKQILQVQENYIDISENASDDISNDSKLDLESKNAMVTEISLFSEDANENVLNDTAKPEKDIVNPSIDNNKKHDSNSINELNINPPVIEIKEDNVTGSSKTEDVQRLNDIDVNNSFKSDEIVEQSKQSSNYNVVADTEVKLEIKDINIPQAELSDDVKKDNNDAPTLVTEDAIKEIHPNDIKDKKIFGGGTSESSALNEDKNCVNISILGDDEITVHGALKQDNLKELNIKSSSVTNTDPEDASSNIENLNTNLADNKHNATKSSDNEDIENIAPHARMINETVNKGSNVDLETAAITIQKVFRSFLFKSRASTFDDTGNDEENFLDEEANDNKEENEYPMPSTITLERRPHGIIRMDTVLQTVNEEKSLSLSTDDSSTLSSAATIIQAHVRGFLVRNKLNSNKTLSTNSFPASNSNEPSLTSLDNDIDQHKNKTVLNIHIVPEGGSFLSRDESLITSMELSLDGSPPSSTNLHPLGYNTSERRKQLKREDAIQSISPPSNNSGKLSEDVDSVQDVLINDNSTAIEQVGEGTMSHSDVDEKTAAASEKVEPAETATKETAVRSTDEASNDTHNTETDIKQRRKSLTRMSSDEMDVVTPLISNEDNNSLDSKLMHSGEFHDLVLPTRVSRTDTTVVREFKSVLVRFLLWNPS